MKNTQTGDGIYYLSGFLAAALWGVMSISLRELVAWSASEVLYFRILVSAAAIWPFILIFRRKKWKADRTYIRNLPRSDKRRLIRLTLLASLFIMANWFTFIYAVNRISVQSAAFAYMVCPLVTTLGAYFLLKEELSRPKKVGLIIAMVSVIMLMQGSLIEAIWSITVALFYALYLIVQRVIKNVDKLNLLAVQITICSLLVLPLFFMEGTQIPTSTTFWWNISLIAVLFTIIPLYLSMYALNGVSASTVGILLYINPMIAFAVAIFYFKEDVTLWKLAAYSILLVAIIFFNWEFVRGFFQNKATLPKKQ